jgi:hypothetical protein
MASMVSGSNVRVVPVLPGCSDPKAAERILDDTNAAAWHQIIDRRAEAAKPALPPSSLDRLLAAPGPLDRFTQAGAGGVRE